jgi:uncharacterized Zn-binding protein involved in type VI secretion
MGQSAARLGDPVAHLLPPVLTGGPVSVNVLIGSQPTWRGADPAQIAALMETVNQAKVAIEKAHAATVAASGTPAAGAAAANETKTTVEQTKKVVDEIANLAASGVSIHACAALLPTPSTGIVTTGSRTVQINGLPACRSQDVLFEGLHAPNAIMGGCSTVLIGG